LITTYKLLVIERWFRKYSIFSEFRYCGFHLLWKRLYW